tara:strand:+ start:265 stop:456 length:192 start_codon:yes stop_codon:yes gene_type:complete
MSNLGNTLLCTVQSATKHEALMRAENRKVLVDEIVNKNNLDVKNRRPSLIRAVHVADHSYDGT